MHGSRKRSPVSCWPSWWVTEDAIRLTPLSPVTWRVTVVVGRALVAWAVEDPSVSLSDRSRNDEVYLRPRLPQW